MKQMQFTYRAYADLVENVRQHGYTITNYQDCKTIVRPCILRHDVDFDLQKAVEFAKFEQSIGVQSTYFILCSSKFYNLLAKDSVRAVSAIHALGHDIGLHFDETNYTMDTDEMFLSMVDFELETMQKVLGLPIRSVSMHRPTKETLAKNWSFMGLGQVINSYSEEFFQSYKYLSDSRMHWRENPFEAVAEGSHQQLHILTHPFWYSEGVEDTRTKLLQFAKRATFDRYEVMNDNFRDLQEFVSREALT